MFDRVTLAHDLADCRGRVLGRKGLVVSAESVQEAAAVARPQAVRPLAETFVAEDLRLPLSEPSYRHLFSGPGVQAGVARAVLAAKLPEALFDELAAMKTADPGRYRHALATAAVATRMLTATVGEARSLPELSAAALLHDLGMRHVRARIARATDALRPEEAVEVSLHPMLGGWHLACVLGRHPAVDSALTHHWCMGQGYPRLSRPPSRSLEVVAVASVFTALTQPRPFRSEPYDARGAVDLLVAEAAAGRADPTSVRLLVHALRGGDGEARHVRFGKERPGHTPVVNRYTPVAAPARSLV